MAASSAALPRALLTSSLIPIPPFNPRISFAPLTSPLSSSKKKKLASSTSSSVVVHLQKSTAKRWRLYAFPENFVLSEASPVEDSQLIDSTNESSGSNIIYVLLFVAFIGLSILTIGVIYIAVTDFLQKRERDKFEKEEAAKKKKGGKKAKITTRARAGPRGFGQKVEDEDEDNGAE